MKIGIVGWGVEGQSAFKYFGPEHEYLIANEEPRNDFPAESGRLKVQFIKSDRQPGLTSNVSDFSYLDGIENCDKIIFAVTSRKNLEKKFAKDSDFWDKAQTVLQVFFEVVKTKNVIGITGTKGKGTTSTLTAKMLEAQGKKVYLGGNIGLGVLDFIKEVGPEDWVVLELSSFQLMDLPYSPHIAVCLMITEEHLDWHASMEEYLEAKAHIFKSQKPDDIAIYYAKNEDSKKIAAYSPGKKIPFYEAPGAYIRGDGMIVIGETEVINKSEVKLLGEHNLQNICAALTAVFEALGRVDKAQVVLSSFGGLEHRLELVREFEGIKYYDDSFATTPNATIVALKAFEQPKVVILGGSDKGLAFEPLADEVASGNVRQVIAIGATADKIAGLLKDRGFSNITLGLSKMPDIVEAARQAAQPGDVVLLSTAYTSFGLFKDYKDRGNQFKAAVRELS
jgi:UDP-N-acetylmuramoylalanine--D-glutamate ligase